MSDPVRLSDLEYLIDLGVTVEDIARRAGRTPDAINAELRDLRADRQKDNQ